MPDSEITDKQRKALQTLADAVAALKPEELLGLHRALAEEGYVGMMRSRVDPAMLWALGQVDLVEERLLTGVGEVSFWGLTSAGKARLRADG